nr:MtxX [uncultured archaeon]
MLIEKIKNGAKSSYAKVAIGVGSEQSDYQQKIIESVGKSLEYARIVLVGNEKCFEKCTSKEVEIVHSSYPEKEMVELLLNGEIDACVRGALKATKMLFEIKEQMKPKKIGRVALLRAHDGHEFLFAPVGIDEGYDVSDKIFLLKEGVKLANKLGIEPKIAVLSGGRAEDRGRSEFVDRTIDDAERVISMAKRDGIARNIKHYHILIEDAIREKADFLLAPDGVSGNLIFRTLTFLGGEYGYGAPFVGLNRLIVDTSRAQSSGEYTIAIALASFLSEGW